MFPKPKFATFSFINGNKDSTEKRTVGNGIKEKPSFIRRGSLLNDEDDILLQPLEYVAKADEMCIEQGLFALNYWYNIPEDKFEKIHEISRALMLASLALDDFSDDSQIRNNLPTPHKIFGPASTVNSVVYTYGIVLEKCIDLGKMEVVVVLKNWLLNIPKGQGMELYWRDSFVCPSEEQYRQMVINKSGGSLFALFEMFQIFSDNKQNYSRIIEVFSIYAQIHNDYCNLQADEYADANKGFAEDITEGKFSFPIIHAIQTHPEDDRILTILKKKTTNVELKKFVISLLENYGSFDYTLQTLKYLKEEIFDEMERVGGNPYIELMIEMLHMQIMKETK